MINRDLDAALTRSARCRACGRRVARADPGCPEHGPIAGAPGDPAGPASGGAPPAIPGYRVIGILGSGGFGVVYAAEREGLGQAVAIKIARRDRPDAAARLGEEMSALLAVGPPAVPALLEVGELEGGAPFLVMERVEAPTLAEHLIASGGPMPLALAAELIDATLRALESIHARGYVHRDLKPENVLALGAEARIIDLGLVAKLRPGLPLRRAASDPGAERTTAVEAVGTAEYMAPEQCEGAPDVDVRADLYAIGVILHELLAGRPPFWGAPAAVLQAHRGERPPRLSTLVPVPPAVEELVLRCLAKDRAERPPTARALRLGLERACAEGRTREVGGAPSASRSYDAAGREKRRVGLVYFRADLDLASLARRLGLGGQLAYASGDRRVVVYSHDVGDNPARRAMRAARELVKRGVCARALVDLAVVTVQLREGGARRFLSPLFLREESFPSPADPGGVFALPGAAAALPELAAREPEAGKGARAEGAGIEVDATFAETREIPLIGREGALATLVAGARRAAAERLPTLVSVIAAPGNGKSHLARALVLELRAVSARGEVIDLRAPDPADGEADLALKDLLQQALALPRVAPPGASLGLLDAAARGLEGAGEKALLAFGLGWIGSDAPELAELRAAPGALRAATAAAAGAALARRAAAAPLFVVLDDAHHADDATLAALEIAALAEGEAPIWICALGRPAFEEARPGWGERAAARVELRLGPLDDAGARLLCRSLLLPAEDVPEPAVERLVARAEAVPLYLVELVRGLKRAGLVRRHPRGDAWFLATDKLDELPDLPLIEWLAQGEIDALPPSQQAHARLVAVLGEGALPAEIEGVLRRLDADRGAAGLPLDARVGTRRLLALGLLVPQRDGRVGFRHALVREAIAASTPEPLRLRIHRAAAEYYQEAQAISDERRLSQLGLHGAAAGLAAIAGAALLTLAERARARHAYVEAERLYSRALEAMDAPSRAALRGRGQVRGHLSRHDDALADLAFARGLAHAEGDVAAEVDLLLDEATALDWMDDYARSAARVREAMARAAGLTSEAIAARLALGIGRTAHRENRAEEAAALLEEAAARAEPLGDEGYETRVVALLLLSFILPALGRVGEARGALDRAIALCEGRRDGVHVVTAINYRAMLRALAGDKEGMVADYARVLALARELGHPMLEIVGHFNLGEYLYLMDDLAAAAPHALRAIALEQRRMGAAARPLIALLEVRLLFRRGDEAGARAALDALDARRDAGAAGTLAPADAVLRDAMELAVRGAEDAAWDELEARSARLSFGQEAIEVLEARAVAALRRGRASESARALEKALAAAARIPNVMGPRLRRLAAEVAALSPRR